MCTRRELQSCVTTRICACGCVVATDGGGYNRCSGCGVVAHPNGYGNVGAGRCRHLRSAFCGDCSECERYQQRDSCRAVSQTSEGIQHWIARMVAGLELRSESS